VDCHTKEATINLTLHPTRIMSAPTPAAATSPREEQADPHERTVEDREAYEYWGYLFKPDKTGTDKLKSLLRGLKEVINTQHDPSDHPDLTPNQLAHFYRELHGNYDQLFLGTPNESIAFIYKSLGCLHSLQPQSFAHSTAFTDPTVPALKTEGWIMWQTIQLLLGPDEHATFITEAVQKWDVKDPATGEVFPKLLPRQCFPSKPDKHMVAWYEGVSERLRREAEEEERKREIEAERAEVRRLHDRVPRDDTTDDEGSVDSRGPALAYFRNPLYRHVDGRPSIVRKNSKRPTLSPRPTVMEKGKGAASTMGHVIRNIGSPHLWDGRAGGSSSESRERDRERRRRSLPDNRHHHFPGDPPPAAPGFEPGLSQSDHRHRRRRSSQIERPGATPAEGEWEAQDVDPGHSPRPSPYHHHHHNINHHHRPYSRDGSLRHSRSHDPTPSQKEGSDYFAGFDDPDRRRNSAYDDATPVSSAGGNGSVGPGGGFAPSASPLFATHVARQPQPQSTYPPAPPQPRMPAADSPVPPRSHSMRSTQHGRPYSRGPVEHDRHPAERRDGSRHRRYDSPGGRSRFDQSPAPSQYDTASSPPPARPSNSAPGQGYPPPADPRRRSGRMSGSDLSGADEGNGRRSGGRSSKQTRFAPGPAPPVSGVAGRKYVPEAPWR